MGALSLEDRQQIQDVCYAYSFYVDSKQYSKCPDLFTEDGVWDESCLGLPVANGKDAIRAGFGAVRPDDLIYFIHFVTSIWIHESSDEYAKAICYLRGEGCFRNGAQPIIRGYYDDLYVKSGNRWLLKVRKLVPFAPPAGWDFPWEPE
jgi:hypothetical protein